MKVVIVNFSDFNGGAARAANRLFNGFEKIGVDARMLVLEKALDHTKISVPGGKMTKLKSFAFQRMEEWPVQKYPGAHKISVAYPSLDLSEHINALQPDIVNIHWINKGAQSLSGLSNIKAPIVWSLHDMWPFTGGCHYDEWCGKYKQSCGSCPVLGSTRENDPTRALYLRKKKAFAAIPSLTIVGLSKWLADSAAESSLFANRKVVNIPNGIDTDKYKPMNREVARSLFNLPQDKTLVLFGAMSGTSEKRKGFHHLVEALKQVKSDNIELVVFGTARKNPELDLGFPVHYLGRLYDEVSLTLLYSAADMMIVPSEQENLSNAIMESLSCGTPVLGFDIGGNGDMIAHRETGYLATAFDAADLAAGIDWVAASVNEGDTLRTQARNRVLSLFKDTLIAERHVHLYHELLGQPVPVTPAVSTRTSTL